MTNEERRQAAWTVFEYEREMYLDLHAMSGKGLSPLHPAVNNAICEARVLHANILCEMLEPALHGPTSSSYLGLGDLILKPVPSECYELKRAHGSWIDEGTLAHACHHRVKTPGACRGSSFDYSEILTKIHEPLVAAMDAVLTRRNQERLDKATKYFEGAVEEAAEEAKPKSFEQYLRDNEVAILRDLRDLREGKLQGGKIISIPKPRFVKLTSPSGAPEFADIAKVMAVGAFESPDNRIYTRVSFSPDGNYWMVVTESPEEVVAKLEGRA